MLVLCQSCATASLLSIAHSTALTLYAMCCVEWRIFCVLRLGLCSAITPYVHTNSIVHYIDYLLDTLYTGEHWEDHIRAESRAGERVSRGLALGRLIAKGRPKRLQWKHFQVIEIDFTPAFHCLPHSPSTPASALRSLSTQLSYHIFLTLLVSQSECQCCALITPECVLPFNCWPMRVAAHYWVIRLQNNYCCVNTHNSSQCPRIRRIDYCRHS